MQAAALGECPLTLGWGEPDGSERGGLSRVTTPPVKLSPVERQQLVEIVVSSRRGRKRKGGGGGGADGELDGSGGGANGGGRQPWQQLPLLWVTIDPRRELPLKVAWTGRGGEAHWAGMPEDMCAP